jgi:VWFA-related protein
MITGFTTDAPALLKTMKDPKAGPEPSVVLDTAAASDVDSAVGALATMGGSGAAVSAMQQFQADLTSFQTDQRVQMTLDAMQQLARYLSAIPGRKNLIWFSGSFPLSIYPDETLQSPFQAMRNYSDDIRETAVLLTSARVAVYPVDARGLMTPAIADASYSPSTNLMGGSSGQNKRRGSGQSGSQLNKSNVGKDQANATKQMLEEQATMEQIAEQTGGVAFINTNGLKEAIAGAIENGSNYYSIGYTPAGNLNGEFRKIEVRIDNSSYKLAYRHGYYADSPDKPTPHQAKQTSLIMAATLHGAPPSTEIPFQVRVLPADDPMLKGVRLPKGPAGEVSLKGSTHREIADFILDPRGLALAETPDGSRHNRIEFTLVAYSAEGLRVNYLDRGFELRLSAEQYAHALSMGVPVRMAIDLPAGPAWLRIAVHDLDAERAGSLEIAVPASH